MAAASVNIPALSVVTGPMLSGTHRGERVGACTDCRRFWARYRAGEIDNDEIEEITNNLVPSAGTCGVMGTASTMACITEALGMMLPGMASGWLQEMLGYPNFFIWVLVVTIPSFIVVALIPLDADFGREKSDVS